jgi:hypothetical protein
MQHGFKHALFVDEAFGLQFIQRPGQAAGLLLVGGQLAIELGAGVLPTAQQAQRPAFEGQREGGHGSLNCYTIYSYKRLFHAG